MIVWPNEQQLGAASRAGLVAFRGSGACRELETSPRRWRVVAFPWTTDAPVRLLLEDDAHERIGFALHDDGSWRLWALPEHVHERTAAERFEEMNGRRALAHRGPS